MHRFTLTYTVLAAYLVMGPTAAAPAAVQTKEIVYKVGDASCHGYLAWDDERAGKRPGVLVFHEWWGLNGYAKSRTEQLAKLGYVAFAADMYGDGKTTEHPQDAGAMAGAVRANQDNWQKRAVAALDVLVKQPQCDKERLAAIGYCFGGGTALELAYTGADLDVVVTFHAALPTPTDVQAKKIKATLVICHGAEDKFIPDEAIQTFHAALTAAKVDWEMNSYGGAVHSFTVPDVDKRNLPGMQYNKPADDRSWARMLQAFKEKLGD